MPPNKQFLSYFPASAAKKDDLYRLERLVEMRKGTQSSINKSDIIRAAFSFYFAAQPEADAINAEIAKINAQQQAQPQPVIGVLAAQQLSKTS